MKKFLQNVIIFIVDNINVILDLRNNCDRTFINTMFSMNIINSIKDKKQLQKSILQLLYSMQKVFS